MAASFVEKPSLSEPTNDESTSVTPPSSDPEMVKENAGPHSEEVELSSPRKIHGASVR